MYHRRICAGAHLCEIQVVILAGEAEVDIAFSLDFWNIFTQRRKASLEPTDLHS
jgi:hypothetical protein